MTDDDSPDNTVRLTPKVPDPDTGGATPPDRTVQVPKAVVVGDPSDSPSPVGLTDPADTADGPVKKGDFIDLVVARSGAKKGMAKPVVEAALAVLAETLLDGKDLNLPPLGKLKHVKSRLVGTDATVVTLKLRTQRPGPFEA